jgi:hypothetical protein
MRMPLTRPVSALPPTTNDDVTSAPLSLTRIWPGDTFLPTETRSSASPPVTASGRPDSTSTA